MKKEIIFVDDEQNVLHGLRLMLRSMRKEWSMQFFTSPQEALEKMEADGPVDVVVSDMRMPNMDGFSFLQLVKEKYPKTLRFALSGETDSKTLLRASNITHHFLNKPCEPDVLRQFISRAFKLRERLQNETIERAMLQMGAIPSIPSVYQEIMQELESPEPSVSQVGHIIEKDVGMSIRVLRIVNSAMMGLSQPVSNPVQAASLLGLENLKNMVLLAGAVTGAEKRFKPRLFNLDELWRHSLRVGHWAQKIAEIETKDKRIINNSFTAGLLHDIGQIALATKLPMEYGKVLIKAQSEKLPLIEAEQAIFDATHAEVGGYILGVWGLSDPIVEATTYHHAPEESGISQFTPMIAVYAANALALLYEGRTTAQLQGAEEEDDTLEPDTEEQATQTLATKFKSEYLETIGLGDRAQLWAEVCESLELESQEEAQ